MRQKHLQETFPPKNILYKNKSVQKHNRRNPSLDPAQQSKPFKQKAKAIKQTPGTLRCVCMRERSESSLDKGSDEELMFGLCE